MLTLVRDDLKMATLKRKQLEPEMSKTYTKSEIATLLMTNDKAIGRALIALNDRQTVSEQAAQATLFDNGIGFSGADARIVIS